MRSVVAVAAILCVGCEKYALDRQMEELCKKDGGVTVFEKVILPASRFDEQGRLKPTPLGASDRARRYGPEYRVVSSTTYLKDGDPIRGQGRLARSEYKLIRTSDNKVLAVEVIYARSGGDFIAFAHPSSKVCASPPGTSIEAVFIRE